MFALVKSIAAYDCYLQWLVDDVFAVSSKPDMTSPLWAAVMWIPSAEGSRPHHRSNEVSFECVWQFWGYGEFEMQFKIYLLAFNQKLHLIQTDLADKKCCGHFN